MGLENVNVHSCMKWKVIHGAALHSVILGIFTNNADNKG